MLARFIGKDAFHLGIGLNIGLCLCLMAVGMDGAKVLISVWASMNPGMYVVKFYIVPRP